MLTEEAMVGSDLLQQLCLVAAMGTRLLRNMLFDEFACRPCQLRESLKR